MNNNNWIDANDMEKLKTRLSLWEAELETNENGMAHVAENVIFCINEKLKGRSVLKQLPSKQKDSE